MVQTERRKSLMKKFWNWTNHRIRNQDSGEVTVERVLSLNGTIAEDSWFDDDVTPQAFKEELNAGSGDITVWINSPGGDCIAAAQIYNMLMEYKGKVTVKIDGIAASAASVIAMSGDTVLMSPVSMLMIHNPATVAFGDYEELARAMDMLNEVKESIINAYVVKTGLSRSKLSHLMDAETWMDANKAIELGFADDIISRVNEEPEEDEEEKKEASPTPKATLYSQKAMGNVLMNKIEKHYTKPKEPASVQAKIEEPETGRSVNEIMERLLIIKKFI